MIDQFEQARPHLERALERSNPDGLLMDEVQEAVTLGNARLWLDNNAAAVTEMFGQMNAQGLQRIWLAGGDLEQLIALGYRAEQLARHLGMNRMVIEETRPGWTRVLKEHGYREMTSLVKEL